MKPTAVVGRRVVALILDGIIGAVISAILFFPLAETNDQIARDVLSGKVSPQTSTYINVNLGDKHYSLLGSKAALFFAVSFVIWVILNLVLPGVKGWSLGKAIVGIRIVKADGSGGPPGIGRAFLRWIMWIVDDFPYIIPLLTGFITAASSERNQRVGDRVAGTLVVDKAFAVQGAGAGLPTAPMPSASTPSPSFDSAPPAAWYPDPQGEKRLRYWDGSTWTANTAD